MSCCRPGRRIDGTRYSPMSAISVNRPPREPKRQLVSLAGERIGPRLIADAREQKSESSQNQSPLATVVNGACRILEAAEHRGDASVARIAHGGRQILHRIELRVAFSSSTVKREHSSSSARLR